MSLEKSLFETKFEEKIETLEKLIVDVNQNKVKPSNYDEVVNTLLFCLQGLRGQVNKPL